jgi:tetratricopeptide (TPR) repeat protein
VATGSLPAPRRRQLELAGLLENPEAPAAKPAAAAAAAKGATAKPAAAKPAAPPQPGRSREVVLDLGDEESAEAPRPAPVATARLREEEPAREQGSDDQPLDELSAMAAALEEELFAEGESLLPEEPAQESVEDIFAAFKARVREHVADEDYRMHYDLGIGFKSMGLLDEAISAFEHAVNSPELHREACTMIAVCHHERGEREQAADWYRKAIDAAVDAGDVLSRLRYDLAEVLLEAGDARGALDQFRDVLETDPSYRDVQGRIRTLETSLGS